MTGFAEKDVLHYCGYPERRGEPALCGMTREPDAEPHMIAWRTTTRGPDVTCAACLAILEGRPIPPGVQWGVPPHGEAARKEADRIYEGEPGYVDPPTDPRVAELEARVAELVKEVPPVRLCCGQRHYGSVCPDGMVMCCICFERRTIEQLHVKEDGTPENVCKACAEAGLNKP